jgi:nucleoid-associated protein YgaU/DNA-binding SARP family transcriptional activator
MSDHRFVQLLRGLGSLAVTLVLIVGVPLLLASWVGWPLPASLPSVDAFEQAAQSGVRDEVLVNALAVIAWLAWAQIALAFCIEAIAVVRGRESLHLPVLPGIQVSAGRLVAGIVVLITTVHPARVSAEPPPVPAAVVAAAPVAAIGESGADALVIDLTGANLGPVADPMNPTMPAPAAAQPTVTVQRHDSYWAIAERTLGDGLRWREILELNAGRTLSDGTTIKAGDPTLYAGWVLMLPSDAVAEPTTASTADNTPVIAGFTSPEAEVVVERGDNLWTISEDRLESDLGRDASDPEVAPYWLTVVDANQSNYVQPGNPSLIYPGQVLHLPPTGHEQPMPGPPSQLAPGPADAGEQIDVPPTAPPPTPPAEPESPAAEDAATTVPTAAPDEASPGFVDTDDRAEGDASEETRDSSVPVTVALGALSSIALAVGLKRLLDRRRRRFANEHPGQIPGQTPPEQRDMHQAIVAQADEERVDDLQEVLGRLSSSLAASGSDRRPRLVMHSDVVEVLLDQPDTDAPRGWASTDDGSVWTLVEAPRADLPYEGSLCPAPLLVTIGQPEDDAQLYLDLEADGLIALTGDRDTAASLARSIVTELTLSPLAETLRVVAIGDVVEPDAKVFEHLTIVDSWDSHVEDLIAWSTQSHDALAENGWANAFIGRGADPDHDALTPVAVVADHPPPADMAAVLGSLQPSAVAVIVVGDLPGALATIRCEDDAISFDRVDLACAPQQMSAEELADIASVLVATDNPAEQALLEQLRADFEAPSSVNGSGSSNDDGSLNGNVHPSSAEAEPACPADAPPEHDVLVRLLGDITIEGGRPLKPKATAVVAYIALNRSVTTARLQEACWFSADGSSHTKRIHDTMAEVRSALGAQHFPANRSGRYVAGPRVRTDVEVFDWHVRHAADLPSQRAVEHYRAALELVTGKPFSYSNGARASFGWVDFEHHATTWELRVAGVAQACAAIHIDAGEPAVAISVLGKLVQAVPLNSALVEALMRAHIAGDDRVRAEAVYREHATALEQAKLGDPEDSIEQLRIELRTG